MNISSIMALFGTMVVLALMPGPSVFAVAARSLASGFTQGLITALGIVIGDFIFILLAIYGLSAIADTLGIFFVFVKYLGGVYLIWLGVGLWRSNPRTIEVEGLVEASGVSSFASGLLITLSDPKAIFFYISFFPAFLDLSQISIVDTGMVMAIAFVAVGGVKVGYAYMADRARLLFRNRKARKRMNMMAGIVMIGTGLFLLVKT